MLRKYSVWIGNMLRKSMTADINVTFSLLNT